MICETCTDALDDTSPLTLEDHVCEGDGCTCRCRDENRRMANVATGHTFPYATCHAPGCSPATHRVAKAGR